jgi:hypothetical protein
MRLITFSGILHETGELMLEPGFIIEGELSSNEGELTVEIFTRGNKVIATTQVPLSAPCAYPTAVRGNEPLVRLAIGLVKFPQKAEGIRVIFKGRTLLERTSPRLSGQPKVEWPNNLNTDSVSVFWRSPQKGAMASLGYSNDNGITWSPLSLPTMSETITFNAIELPGGTECLLELTVTDGFETTRLQSQKYFVKPKGWVLWILSPDMGIVLLPGESVLLAAQGYHLEERRPSFNEIIWTSSIDGGLGRGAQVMATLSTGEHTITATMLEVSSKVRISIVK